MKKKLLAIIVATTTILAASTAFAGNTYLNGYEGEYFNSIPDDPRTWFGYSLKIYNMTDTDMTFDFQYEKPGHAVEFTAEKAVFTDAYTATARGTCAYADQPANRTPVTYNFRFTDNHILLDINNSSGDEMYSIDFNSASGVLSKGITVLVNNQEVNFEQKPIIVNERTLVPLRAIMEALGANVEWNDATKTVISNKDNTTVKLSIGSDTMYVNDNAVKIDSPAQIVNGFTLVPVRAISEAYNTTVNWDGSTKTVSITTSANTTENVPVSYDDISAEVNQINAFMEQGLYIEVMQKCEQVKAQYNISYSDSELLAELHSTANLRYQQYLEEQSKITYEKATQILADGFDADYRPDLRYNLISEDDNYYHIRVLWHNSMTGSDNLWGNYGVDKKSGSVVQE